MTGRTVCVSRPLFVLSVRLCRVLFVAVSTMFVVVRERCGKCVRGSGCVVRDCRRGEIG